jgi:hypothetical protein
MWTGPWTGWLAATIVVLSIGPNKTCAQLSAGGLATPPAAAAGAAAVAAAAPASAESIVSSASGAALGSVSTGQFCNSAPLPGHLEALEAFCHLTADLLQMSDFPGEPLMPAGYYSALHLILPYPIDM